MMKCYSYVPEDLFESAGVINICSDFFHCPVKEIPYLSIENGDEWIMPKFSACWYSFVLILSGTPRFFFVVNPHLEMREHPIGFPPRRIISI